jgi:hypothetical protein
MGLDWNPGNKPKPGCEKEFKKLFLKLQSDWCFRRKSKTKRFLLISIPAYETLDAPRIGSDAAANRWAREIYAKQPHDIPEDEWLKNLEGAYVVALVPPCDGIPRYSNGSFGGYVEPFSFRAQFLIDTTDIIGPALINAAYESKLPADLLDYGTKLLEMAGSYAEENAMDIANLNTEDADSVESRLDAVVAAGRWCLFWAERGHTLDAYS